MGVVSVKQSRTNQSFRSSPGDAVQSVAVIEAEEMINITVGKPKSRGEKSLTTTTC